MSGARCPACGEFIDCCQGHGESGDPYGYMALELHDNDVHSHCHPLCCESVEEAEWVEASEHPSYWRQP